MDKNMNLKTIKLINILNIIIWLFIFVFITYKFRYLSVIHDDVCDIIVFYNEHPHGRIVMDFIISLFVKFIPEFFHIHYQDFAIVSEAGLKAFFIATLSYLSAIAYNRFYKKNMPFPYMVPVFSVLSFLFFLSVLHKYEFFWSFENNQYHTGYFSCVILYLLFWYKLFDFYRCKSGYTKKNIILLLLLSMIAQTSNEELNIVLIFILFCVLLETIIKYCRQNNADKIYYLSRLKVILTIIIVMVSMSLLLYMQKATADLFENYIDSSLTFRINLITISHFVYEIFHKIIIPNILILIPLLFNIIYIFINKTEENIYPLKYVIYTLFGFSFFVAGTLFLPQNCYIVTDDVIYSFWFCARTLLVSMIICLFVILLFTSGVVISNEKSKRRKNIIICLILTCIISYIMLYIKSFSEDSADIKIRKETLYKYDKMSVFYFNQNKTAILPNGWEIQMFMYEGEKDSVDLPYVDPNKIFYEDDSTYLFYIHYVYKVDVSPGVRFVPTEQAMEAYYKNGGTLTEEELKELRFSRIK